MKTIVIIQARMGSSRLPGKVLMPLGNNSIVLDYVVSRCKKINGVNEVIVATSNLSYDEEIFLWCQQRDIICIRGDEQDVLKRFVKVAEIEQPHYIVRVTADCPFVDYEMASEMINLIKTQKVDIIDIEEELPRGLAVEVFSYNALIKMDKQGKERRHREHVTHYAYEYKEQFNRVNYEIPRDRAFPHLRITLDTLEDYKMLKEIANYFESMEISSAEVISFLNSNPEIPKINFSVKQKPVI